MVIKSLLLGTIYFVCITAVCDRDALEPVEWTGGSFSWADVSSKALHKSLGLYISKNCIATRAQIYKDHIYLALPRYKLGVAATLARVSVKAGCDAVLEPFPCWSTQQVGDCKAIQSAVDIYRDAQDVLWVLDTGVVDTLKCPVRQSPPKALAFSLCDGKLLKTLDLSGLVIEPSRLQYIVCDYDQSGRPYVYISDAATRSILVFDILGNKGFRVILPKVITQGCHRRDVLYIALTRKGCGNNYLVFTYLGGNRIFSIRTDYLRVGSTNGRIIDLGAKPEKLVILGTDDGSAIFFRYDGQQEVYRWDTSDCFKPENFLKVYNPDHCFLPTQVFADPHRHRVRILQSNFPDFIHDTVGCGAVQKVSVVEGSC